MFIIILAITVFICTAVSESNFNDIERCGMLIIGCDPLERCCPQSKCCPVFMSCCKNKRACCAPWSENIWIPGKNAKPLPRLKTLAKKSLKWSH
uniref:Cysteine rich secreted protein n=1 Tax=Riptortus pedestris TaxID=329032 RepID=R4WCJ7_RIPPE|nr:cysteine rich secreted protein [Riptortus pedestris]